MSAVAVPPVPAPAADTTPAVAKRLHEVLREEHEYLHAAPRNEWWASADSSPIDPPTLPEWAAQPTLQFKKDEAAQQALVTRTGEFLASSASLPAAPRTREDLACQKLAQWIREAREAAAGGEAAAESHAGPTWIGEIQQVVEKKVTEDLPHTEPWLQDVELRPFTRGLLKQHRQRWVGVQLGKYSLLRRKPDPLLNLLLLEDAFARHVVRHDDERLREVFKAMRESGRAALCLSGGGIRSATFALGVVQGLARHGVLPQFRYLSSVSGGGYLGSWLSAWSRHETFPNVVQKLGGDQSAMPGVESAPLRHLRQYSNYLSPRLGLLSGDSWTLVATFLRNLLLIWLVIVPLLAAVTMIPWVFTRITALDVPGKTQAEPWRPVVLVALAVSAALLAARAIYFVHAYRPETEEPEWEDVPRGNRDQHAFLRRCLLPLSAAVLMFALVWHWFETWNLAQPGWLARLRLSFRISMLNGPAYWSEGARSMMWGGAMIHFAGWFLALVTRRRAWRQKGFLLRWAGGWKALGWKPALLRAGKRAWEAVLILGTGAAAGYLLLLTRLVAGVQIPRVPDEAVFVALTIPGFLLAVTLAGFAFEGMASRRVDDARREWTARYSAWLLVVAVGWLAFSSIILFGPVLAAWPRATAGTGLGAGILAALLGRSAVTAGDGDGAAARKDGPGAGKSRLGAAKAAAARITLPVAAAVAVVGLLVGLSFLDMALIRWVCSWGWVNVPPPDAFPLTAAAVVKLAPLRVFVGVGVALLVLGQVLGWFIQTNRFSLHAMYRARLIRAYLGASRPAGERRPDPFTGFDEADNFTMGTLHPGDPPPAGERPPFHVLNLALNLVAGRNLAWQERKASSFSVSPLHAGAHTLGYRPTWLPDPAPGRDDPRYYGGKKGITLGTAMTISGAAASPNMGYHSSPAVTFLMTLFNARLGWWLGNPGPAGDRTFHDSSPRSALRPLIDEMAGATNDTNEYVYLSDGGHFENLGLYEMVLRRNRFIVVSDASCDEECSLQDLGNAIRKVRIDLGIPIEFGDDFTLRARSSDPTAPEGHYWAFARIRYSCVDVPTAGGAACDAADGVLLYIKPGIYGGEPRDVFNYAAANPAFPHESTADQFFSESQFESYRALGSHVVERLVRALPTHQLESLFTAGGQEKFLAEKLPLVPRKVEEPARGPKVKIQGIVRVG